ncbi:MAG: hypothetical protein ABII02_02210 [Candidatus Magasanikbacteria bacterium]
MYKKKLLNTAIAHLKDCLFPVFCLGCDREGDWLCDSCFDKLNGKEIFCCPVCHAVTELGRCCSACEAESYVDAHGAALQYSEQGLIGKVVHTFKYNYAEELDSVFRRMVIDFVSRNPSFFSGFDAVVPVPLHNKRYAERGFNQASTLAGILSHVIAVPVSEDLQRIRHTHHQARLERRERFKNIDQAFSAKAPTKQNIILVDDVFTTGATMQACAWALKESGSRKVVGFSIARG